MKGRGERLIPKLLEQCHHLNQDMLQLLRCFLLFCSSDKTSIARKFNHVQFTTLSADIEFDYNPFVTFLVLTSAKYNSSHMKPLSLPGDRVMLLTERQTNKEIYLKHNFLCKGGRSLLPYFQCSNVEPWW